MKGMEQIDCVGHENRGEISDVGPLKTRLVIQVEM